MQTSPVAEWVSQFAELAELGAKDRHLLESHAQKAQVPAGTTVFAPGKKPDAFLFVLEGTVRVQQVAENGREIVLYRVVGGESCIMTTACLLSDETYQAEGVTETDVTAIMISSPDFDNLMAHSAAFRRFVFTKYASRMADIMTLVEDVAFQRMDKRLAHKLLELAKDNSTLDITHQRLAVELGSVREVVSRLMKEFARRGWIGSTRGHIEILDHQALVQLAEN